MLTMTRLFPPQYIASLSSPTTLVLNPAYASWFEIDQLLLSVLMSTISKTLVPSLVGLNSSRAVWLTLEKMFSSQSRARVMTTRYTLATLKKGNLTITDYFQKAKACTDLLASIGEPISDSAITSYILAGLPHDYDSLIATQALSSPDITAPSANFAAKTSQPSQNRGRQFYSQHGRNRGHGRTNFSRGQGSPQFSSSNSSSSRAFCQICFKVGHTAQACYHRFDQNFQVSSNQSPQAFAASTSSTVDPACLNHKGYKCLDSTTNRIYIARNVVFDEHVFPYATSLTSHATHLVPPSHIRLPSLTNSNHLPHSYPLPPTPKISPTKSPTLSPPKYPPLSPQISPPKSLQPSLTDSASPKSHTPSSSSSIPPNESSPPTSASPRVSTNDSLQVPCDDTQAVAHPMQTQGKDNISKPKVFFPGIVKYPLPKALLAATDQDSIEPTSYTAASKHPSWRAAMNTEFTALLHNGTWKLVPPKPNMNLVGCKWVFRIK
uniref:Retroviral polymerase SH3-like domain-containing protein n=1 Tax=Fagus sylvatica TaxID=28930 RepID=A0A2N9GF05_FAGSY